MVEKKQSLWKRSKAWLKRSAGSVRRFVKRSAGKLFKSPTRSIRQRLAARSKARRARRSQKRSKKRSYAIW